MKTSIAIIAALLAIAGNVPYLMDVFKGRVKPHAYTWLVWSIVSAITFFGQVAKGAGVDALPTAASEVFTVIIFLASLKYGFRPIAAIDTWFLLLALAGIIPWIVMKDPTVSVITVVTIDVVAFIPTLRKTWMHPTTESPTLYTMNVLRHSLAMFSLQAYNIATTLHSIAMITANTVMTGILILRPRAHRGPARG